MKIVTTKSSVGHTSDELWELLSKGDSSISGIYKKSQDDDDTDCRLIIGNNVCSKTSLVIANGFILNIPDNGWKKVQWIKCGPKETITIKNN